MIDWNLEQVSASEQASKTLLNECASKAAELDPEGVHHRVVRPCIYKDRVEIEGYVAEIFAIEVVGRKFGKRVIGIACGRSPDDALGALHRDIGRFQRPVELIGDLPVHPSP